MHPGPEWALGLPGGACRDTPQPFVSWMERMPWLVNGGMLLSVAGMVMCMLGLYVKRR